MAVKITRVEKNSIAEAAGIRVSDEIISVNQRPIRDVIDLRFQTAQDRFVLRLKKAAGSSGGEAVLDLDLDLAGEDLGIEIEDFRTKGCNNKCVFCFVDQLPARARSGLRFKDDDYRLSFLHGNYITLTNMRSGEIDRIIEQRLGPLYVSVHATDLEVRNRMLGRAGDGGFREKFEKLVAGGVTLHTQVVLCPTYNDGPVLQRTVFDLHRYYPGVASVSIVPLGLSRHRSSLDGLVPVTGEFCEAVIDQVAPYQEEFRRRSGCTFAYLADEFYIVTGRPLPPARHYDGFPLTEDGIGMVRLFAEDFSRNLQVVPRLCLEGLQGTVATGTLFAAALRAHIQALNQRCGSRLELLSVVNDFLGEGITVAGLLAGRDIATQAQGKVRGDFLMIPSEAVSNADRLFVDDTTIAQLSEQVGVPVLESGLTVDSFFVRFCRLAGQPALG